MSVCGGGGCCFSVCYTDYFNIQYLGRRYYTFRVLPSFYLPLPYIHCLAKQREKVVVFSFASNMWKFSHVEICMSSIAAGVSVEGVLFLSFSLLSVDWASFTQSPAITIQTTTAFTQSAHGSLHHLLLASPQGETSLVFSLCIPQHSLFKKEINIECCFWSEGLWIAVLMLFSWKTV